MSCPDRLVGPWSKSIVVMIKATPKPVVSDRTSRLGGSISPVKKSKHRAEASDDDDNDAITGQKLSESVRRAWSVVVVGSYVYIVCV